VADFHLPFQYEKANYNPCLYDTEAVQSFYKGLLKAASAMRLIG
jgi:hypothetical protein